MNRILCGKSPSYMEEACHNSNNNNNNTVIIIIVNCNWVVTRWQWLFYEYMYTNTKKEVTRKFKSGGLHEKYVVAT